MANPTGIILHDFDFNSAPTPSVGSSFLGLDTNTNNISIKKSNGDVIDIENPQFVKVADFASLPVTGNIAVLYLTIDTGILYGWDGADYNIVSPSTGGGGLIKVADYPALLLLTGDTGIVYMTNNNTGIYEWTGSEYRRVNRSTLSLMGVDSSTGNDQDLVGIVINKSLAQEDIVVTGFTDVYASGSGWFNNAIKVDGLHLLTKTLSFVDLETLFWGFNLDFTVGDNVILEAVHFPMLKILGTGVVNAKNPSLTLFTTMTFPELEEVHFKRASSDLHFKIEAPNFTGLQFPKLKKILAKYYNGSTTFISLSTKLAGGVSMPLLEIIDGLDGSVNGANIEFSIGNEPISTGNIVIGTKLTPFTVVNCDTFYIPIYGSNVTAYKFYASTITAVSNSDINLDFGTTIADVDLSELIHMYGSNSSLYIGLGGSTNITSIDLSKLITCQQFWIGNSPTLTSILINPALTATSYSLDDLDLDQTTVDSVLLAAVATGQSTGYISIVNPTYGTSSAPSVVGLAAITTLTTGGNTWTINVNP